MNILFLALPHEQSRELAPPRSGRVAFAWLISPRRGACSTIENRAIYKLQDANPECAGKLQERAVYGSPELHAGQIKSARPGGEPGLLCDVRHSWRSLRLVRANLADLSVGLVADAKSGVSGAGKATDAEHALYVCGRQSFGVCGLQSPPHGRVASNSFNSRASRSSLHRIFCRFHAAFFPLFTFV